MSQRTLISVQDLTTKEFAQLSAAAERLKALWLAGQPPLRLDELLPKGSGPVRIRMLVELIKDDMEWCVQCGHARKALETYVAECRELHGLPEALAELRAADPRFQSTEPIGLARANPANPEKVSAMDSAHAPQLAEGFRFGSYVVRRRLGRGGMGEVYLAHDEELDREVAIKVPGRYARLSPEAVEHLLEEARKSVRLKHAGIVPVHHVGRLDDGMLYVVMEYMERGSLRELLNSLATRREKLPYDHVVRILLQVADALGYAHSQDLVHRDIKPENILFDSEGRACVADLGLALHASEQPQMKGDCAGTGPYMAPEQFRGEAHWMDGRTDIWALGVMLYEMLTGRRPFQGRTRDELEDEVLHREPKPPRMVDPRIPASLEKTCLNCLSKEMGDRYAVLRDLVNIVSLPARVELGMELQGLLELGHMNAIRQWFYERGRIKMEDLQDATRYSLAIDRSGTISVLALAFPNGPKGCGAVCRVPICDTVVDFVSVRCFSYRAEIDFGMFGRPTWCGSDSSDLQSESMRLEQLIRWCDLNPNAIEEAVMRRLPKIFFFLRHRNFFLRPRYSFGARILWGRRHECGENETRIIERVCEVSYGRPPFEVVSYDRVLDALM